MINKIKAHPLNDRLFRQFCLQNDAELLNSAYNCTWRSGGYLKVIGSEECLTYLIVISNLGSTNNNIPMEISVLKSDIASLADIYAKIN